MKIVKDLNGNSKGYGFVEFEHKSDCKNAYRKAEGRRIDDRKIAVDYEKSRADKDFKPRRLGGRRGEHRNFPYWLDKELREIKEMFPEIVDKYRKKELNEDKEYKNGLNKKRKRSVSKEKAKDEEQLMQNKIIDLSNSEITNDIQMNDQTLKLKNVAENDGNFVSINNNNNNNKDNNILDAQVEKDGKKVKKEKKEKKDKKDKKEKKEKKDKKSKKDKKEKRKDDDNSIENGEIV